MLFHCFFLHVLFLLDVMMSWMFEMFEKNCGKNFEILELWGKCFLLPEIHNFFLFDKTRHNKTRHNTTKYVTKPHHTFLQKTGGRAIAAKARSAWRSVASVPPGLGLPSAGNTAGAAQHGAQHGVPTAVPPGFLPPQVSSCASAPHVSSHRRLTM